MKPNEPWRHHPLAQEGKIAELPMEWVWKHRGVDVTPVPDLADGTLTTMDGLRADIATNGLLHPLIIRIGRLDGNYRLESGNHRIQLLKESGYQHIPITVQVRDTCGPDREDRMTDATHVFHRSGGFHIPDGAEEYIHPFKVFPELHS